MRRRARFAEAFDPRMLALLSGVFLTTVTQSALVPALPPLGALFSAGPGAVQAVLSVGLFSAALAFIPLALLAGRWGASRVFRFSLALHALVSVLLFLAPSLWAIVALRGVQGVAIAGIVGLVPGLAVATWPRRPGYALGLIASTVALGQLLGPAAGGLLSEAFGPQSVFLLSPPLAMVGLWQSPHLPDFPPRALPLAGLFQRRFLLGLLRTVFYFAYIFGAVLASAFFLSSLGLGAARVGLWLLIPPGMLMIFGARAGRYADRVGFSRAMALGASVLVFGVALAWVSLGVSPLASAALVLASLGLGRALFQSANNADVLARAPAGAEALASALLSVARVSGQSLGTAEVGTLLEAGARLGEFGAYALTVTVLVLPVLALVVWWGLGRRRARR